MSRTEPDPTSGTLPRFSAGVSAASVVAVAALVAPAPAPLAVVAFGGALVAVGLYRRTDGMLALGAGTLFAAVVLAGIEGRSLGWVLAAAVPAVLAWTSARHALQLAAQVGGAATTLRVELVRTIATSTALVAGGASSYLVTRTVSGGSSPLALALLLVAVVAFTIALR